VLHINLKRSFVWVDLLCLLGGWGCLVAKIGHWNTNNLPKFTKVPGLTSYAFRRKSPSEILPDNMLGQVLAKRLVQIPPMWHSLWRSKWERRASGFFTSSAMVRIKTGMSWGHFPRLPLTFVNIIISLLVISRIIFYWKHFWAPGSHFLEWRESKVYYWNTRIKCLKF
jgi:hypothetical protein